MNIFIQLQKKNRKIKRKIVITFGDFERILLLLLFLVVVGDAQTFLSSKFKEMKRPRNIESWSREIGERKRGRVKKRRRREKAQ